MKSNEFPYKDLVDSEMWIIIEKAIADLVKNGDIIEQTQRKYIIAYITKKVTDSRSKKAK